MRQHGHKPVQSISPFIKKLLTNRKMYAIVKMAYRVD
uniref:Uncharacterized protein n=1 Tax=Siphoviridae sp. ctiMP24 TaxID=2825621 RepID=A0A8S5NYY9_9CAUD|nr:MAG TPA: hypothetical protein [Siphoviridae sp. ctiMP24]